MNSTRCLYKNSFSGFKFEKDHTVLGIICDNYHGDAVTTQIEAWKEEIAIIKDLVSNLGGDGQVIFEYDIPRLRKRIDVVILTKGIIFCLEFKIGESKILEKDIDQVFDYALDLKNFHKLSQDNIIVPILICTEYKDTSSNLKKSVYDDKVVNPLVCNQSELTSLFDEVIKKYPNEKQISENWIISPYSPTPTIIEAAKTLYETHSVENITRHEADDVETDKTINYILEVINKSKKNGEKSICFVTGVPGAGKTLVGLDVAIKQTYQGKEKSIDDEGAVYLSGNGPLVTVLSEALARDNKKNNPGKKITDSRREVSKFIQTIHSYRDNMLAKIKNPVENGVLEIDATKALKNNSSGFGEVEHVAIFDEAQRTWTLKKLATYLKRGGTYGNKLKVDNFPLSEAEFLIWSLNQREDWATIVCLVGGGQEINTGEGGISEWIKALNDKYNEWKVYISPNLKEKEYANGKVNSLLKNNKNVTYSNDLNLKATLRSFKAEKLSDFVQGLLTFDKNTSKFYDDIKNNYPIILTRDIEKAKKWLHDKVRGSERTGVLISKESARYKPLGIHVLGNADKDTIHWFLDDKTNIKSSNYLEDAANEIQVQGLELDYTCVLWDADLRYDKGKWRFYRFNGDTKWVEIKADNESKQEQIKYMINAYRVLLTRARIGMIICIPSGNANKNSNGYWEDSTRLPEFYDGTFNYLKSLGLKEI